MSNMASILEGVHGEPVALAGVSVRAVLQDLLAEVEVSQTYRNDEQVNIEAVYTFPLPLDAVLLELQVEIGGRVLKGTVTAKKAAEEQYEDAVEGGDAAVMLEAAEPGLYTMNVGNLLAGETATITFRYALLYRWSGARLRLTLPTTIAPRYGESPLPPHQAPVSSISIENRFSLRLELRGALQEAQFDCPTHALRLDRSAEQTVLSLQQEHAVMDRDFVLNVRAPKAARSFALCGEDGAGVAALASFQPFFPGLRAERRLDLVAVIDCSGSMEGDSIAQARQALAGILDALMPADTVAIVAFGTTTKVLAPEPLACNPANLAKARRFAQALKADMGGTEIAGALRAAYRIAARTDHANLLLVTDGEVSAWEEVVADAAEAGHRVFTVGIGSAVSEAFVRGLAAATGGGCELVSPREDMAERIVRHFERMRAPRARRAAILWPEGATGIAPAEVGAVFEGDTVVASCRFGQAPVQGAVVLEVETESGEVARQELALGASVSAAAPDGRSTVARVAAAARLKVLDPAAAAQVALDYRLVSPWTNWLVVAPRAEAEKPAALPELRQVPQTLAAGWGGAGRVDLVLPRLNSPRGQIKGLAESRVLFRMSSRGQAGKFGTPMFLRKIASEPEAPDLWAEVLELINADPSQLDPARARDLLARLDLADAFDALLERATDLGLSPDAIAAILLARVLWPLRRKLASRAARTALKTLRARADADMDALRSLAVHTEAIAQLVPESAASELLREPAAREARERSDSLQGLLHQIGAAARAPVPSQPVF